VTDWGDVGTWAGVAVAVAAAAGGIAYQRRSAARQRRDQLADETRRREEQLAAEARRRADSVAFSIARGGGFQELPTWTVRAENRGSQPIYDLTAAYAIRAWTQGPMTKWPWIGPHYLGWPELRPGDVEDQDVFWEGKVNEIEGPTLLGAKFRDDRGEFWVREARGGWRRVGEVEFRDFRPTTPP